VDKAKPFDIPKREIWEAFKKVKANQGAAGVDGQSVADFEAGLSNNLYKLWNRLASGSHFPPPVRRSIFRRAIARQKPDHWGFRRSRTGLPRKSSSGTWSPSWNRSSMKAPMDIDRAGRRLTQFGRPVSDAGGTTGCSMSTCGVTSTALIGNCS